MAGLSKVRVSLRVLMTASTATAILAFGLLHASSGPALGGYDEPAAKPAATRAAFIAEIQRTLKEDDLRLIALANQILGDPTAPETREDRLARLRIDAMKAEGEYQYATMKREIAEMALKEYTEAVLPQELTAAEAEVNIAQADLVQARDRVGKATEEVEKIQAKLAEYKAGFTLQQAESKKKVLVEYTKDHHTKELKSQLAKARSDERGKKAEWELLKNRIEKMHKAATAQPDYTDVEKQILVLLDRAAPIEEQIQAALQHLKKDQNPNSVAEKEVRGLTDKLGAIIDEAEAVKAAADFARVKPRLRKAARWFGR